MTVREAFREGQSILYFAEVDTPVLDASVLLSEALGITKERLFASFPETIEEDFLSTFRQFLSLRCSGIPVSYIRRKKEFYGIEFFVDDRVLVPRPETELLVEETLRILRDNPDYWRVLDCCTGSGCVAVSIKREMPHIDVCASDISISAGEVFQINAEKITGSHIPFFLSDLLTHVPGHFDIVSSNPPYLRDDEVEDMNKIGWPEPDLALKGGTDGMEIVSRLITQARCKLVPWGYLLIEAAPGQMKYLTAFLEMHGFMDIEVIEDLAGKGRVIRGRKRN